MLSRLLGSTATRPASSKIKLGCGAMQYFVSQIHRDPVRRHGTDYCIDRGVVASFDDSLTVAQPFTPYKEMVAAALRKVEAVVLDGPSRGTALNDSLVTIGESLPDHCRPDAVGLIVAVTDGKDEHSERFANNPVAAGEAFRRNMARSPAPHLTVLIGVGSDREIDRLALKKLADHGGMTLVTVDDMGKLGEVLAALGTQISAGVQVETIRGRGFEIRKATPTANVSIIPYDYVLLMDASGSMKNAG